LIAGGASAFYSSDCGPLLSRRRFLRVGGEALVGAVLASSRLAEATPQADGTRIMERYVVRSPIPWALVHGIRGLNRDYRYGDGTAARHILSGYVEERVVDGHRALAFPIGVEAHTDAFLKTFLEAGLPLDFSFTVKGRPALLRDVAEGARRLFRFEPATQDRDDLAWSLIAFSITTPPSRDTWTNAWGQAVRLREVVEFAFRVVEEASAPVSAAIRAGKPLAERAPIHRFTCGGTHLIYSLVRAVHAGYTEQQHGERLRAQLDLLVRRLVADVEMIDAFYRGQPDLTLHRTDAVLKFTGHALECLNAAATWGLWAPRPAQGMGLQHGRDQLQAALAKVAQVDLAALLPAQRQLYDLLTGDTCHAVHGLGFARQVV